MKLRMNIKWRRYIKAAIWVLGIAGILASLISLPPAIGFPSSLAVGILTWLAGRIVYQQHTLWVYPGPSPEIARNWLGTCWSEDDQEGLELGIVFESKLAAKHMFQLFRSWTGGAYRDTRADIRVSLVRESPTRYTIVVYPGARPWARQAIASATHATLPKDAEATIHRTLPYFQVCADYANNSRVLGVIEKGARQRSLLLNTYYVAADDIIRYAKRGIETNGHTLTNRADIAPSALESRLHWTDPRLQDPIKSARVRSLESRAVRHGDG